MHCNSLRLRSTSFYVLSHISLAIVFPPDLHVQLYNSVLFQHSWPHGTNTRPRVPLNWIQLPLLWKQENIVFPHAVMFPRLHSNLQTDPKWLAADLQHECLYLNTSSGLAACGPASHTVVVVVVQCFIFRLNCYMMSNKLTVVFRHKIECRDSPECYEKNTTGRSGFLDYYIHNAYVHLLLHCILYAGHERLLRRDWSGGEELKNKQTEKPSK